MTYPSLELHLDKDGGFEQPAQLDDILALAPSVTDLYVVSHGWNNDRKDATDLYKALRGNLEKEAQALGLHDDRTFGFVGILWPSKRFDVDDSGGLEGARRMRKAGEVELVRQQLRRLAAAIGDEEAPRAGGARRVTKTAAKGGAKRAAKSTAKTAAKGAAKTTDRRRNAGQRDSIDYALELVPQLDQPGRAGEVAAAEFLATVIGLMPARAGEEGDPLIGQAVAASAVAPADGGRRARELLERLGNGPVDDEADEEEDETPRRAAGRGGISRPGRAAGIARAGRNPRTGRGASTERRFQAAAGIGDWMKGVVGGALNLVNYVTYYQMKERAGVVGRNGVNELLRSVARLSQQPRIHLIGHSFGARVVTAAATGPRAGDGSVASTMALLQGAFSHYGFARKYDGKHDGFFRNLVDERRIAGPMLVTHTRNDKAVGMAYALASRVARQIARALGDRNDKYGGLGSNGAQKTPEATDLTLLKSRTPYDPLGAGAIHNLHAGEGKSGLIADHGDVTNPHVAWAVVNGVARA